MTNRCGFPVAPLAALALMSLTGQAGAVVVRGDALDRPALGFVGGWAGSSAVLIGPDWAITARHTGGGVGDAFTLHGESFTVTEYVANPDADLALIRLNAALPAWHRILADPQIGERLVVAGMGRTKGAPIGSIGWDWTGPARETWGENVLSVVAGVLIGARFTMDPGAALPHESGIAANDSGGGMFVEGVAGTHLLAGINVGVSQFGQTVDGSVSYALSLAPYVPWIQSVVGYTVVGSRTQAFVPTPGSGALLFMAAAIGVRRRR